MAILIIVGIILIIAGLIYSVYKVNEHGEMKYGYTPVNVLTMALVIIPYVLLIISLFMGNKNEALLERGNFLAALAVFAIANLILLMILLRKTSVGMTLLVMPIMHTSGVLLLVFYVVTSVLNGVVDADRARRY